MIIPVRVILMLSILFSSYYFIYLKPKVQLAKNISELEKVLTLNKTTLTQNRIAYIELTRLNSESPSFTREVTNIIAILEKTQKDGSERIQNQSPLPKTNTDSNKITTLLHNTDAFYREQQELMKKIKQTGSYNEGLSIIKSGESVKLLTKQTNLILEYGYWLDELKIPTHNS